MAPIAVHGKSTDEDKHKATTNGKFKIQLPIYLSLYKL